MAYPMQRLGRPLLERLGHYCICLGADAAPLRCQPGSRGLGSERAYFGDP